MRELINLDFGYFFYFLLAHLLISFFYRRRVGQLWFFWGIISYFNPSLSILGIFLDKRRRGDASKSLKRERANEEQEVHLNIQVEGGHGWSWAWRALWPTMQLSGWGKGGDHKRPWSVGLPWPWLAMMTGNPIVFCRFWLFKRGCYPIYDIILYLYLLSVGSFRNIIFRISNYFIYFYR